MHPQQDIGAFVKGYDGNASATAGAPILVVAAGAGDAVKVNGQAINRINGTAIAHSCVVLTGYLFALGDGETISLAHEYQTSPYNSTWATAVVIEASTVKATSSGGTNERGVSEHDLALSTLPQYIRINVTPDLSRGATDTGFIFTVVVLGGWTQVPQ